MLNWSTIGKRNIVHFAVASDPRGPDTLYALCSDGSFWRAKNTAALKPNFEEWQECLIQPLPQPKIEVTPIEEKSNAIQK